MGMYLEGENKDTNYQFNLPGWSLMRRLLADLGVSANEWPTLNDGEPVSEEQATEAGTKLLEALENNAIRLLVVRSDQKSPYNFVKSSHEAFVTRGSPGFDTSEELGEDDIQWLRKAADFFVASKGFKCY